MAAIALRFSCLQVSCRICLKSIYFPILRSCSSIPTFGQSPFYNRHSLAALAEKKRLLCIEESPEVKNVVEFEVSSAEWKFVERLIPPLTVPIVKNTNGLRPSGWKPPEEKPLDLPYYVQRQRTQELPVFLEVSNGQTRHITKVRYIEGDIWAFARDLRKHLETVTSQKLVRTQVHEIANMVRFKGSHVEEVKHWLMQQGF